MLGNSGAFCTKGDMGGPKWTAERKGPPMDHLGDLGVGRKESENFF